MTDALLDAERLAAAVVEGMSGSRPLDAAFSDYGRRRDAAARPMHGLTAGFAGLAPPPPAMIELLHALRGNPADTARFLGVIARTVAVDDFYAPANLARITGGELAA